MATDRTILKRRAAESAVELVQSGMKLGLGTGSTAEEFANLLAARITTGELERIECVPTSSEIEAYAVARGISCGSLGKIAKLDLAVDGADEVDPDLRLIKGRGGALLREKIVAQASERFVVIIDDSKLVDRLGRGPLPVEVSPFAADRLIMIFSSMGLDPAPRLNDAGWLITDEGNRIIDVTVPNDREAGELVDEMRSHAGVVDTGFFPNEASVVIVAAEGGVRRLERS